MLTLVPVNPEWLDGYRTALDRLKDVKRRFLPSLTIAEAAVLELMLSEAQKSCPHIDEGEPT